MHKDYIDTLAFSDGLNNVIPVVCALQLLCAPGYTILVFLYIILILRWILTYMQHPV